jgi:hypothetical protein
MKNQNPQDILNEILLRMRYNSSKTLSENKEIILEQGGYYYTPAGQLVGYPGTNNSNIPAKEIYPNITNNKYPQTADFGKIQTALAGRNINKIVSQMPKPVPFNKPQIPQSDVLGPQGWYPRSLGVDKKTLEIAAKLKPLNTIPSDISTLYKWFLEFRTIWQSTSMQVMQTAIGIAFGSVTEGAGYIAVLLIDWGVDVLILLIDFLYAINDPNSDEKWNRVKESTYTVALFGAIGATFKGAKNASQWIRKNVKQIERLIQTIKVWLTKLIKSFGSLGKPITEPIKQAVEYINKKLFKLLGTAVAGYVSVFFLNALPVAGAMVALIKINEEKITNTISPLLNKTVGLGIDELRLIAGGPNMWQKNGILPSSEQFRLASKVIPEKDTTKIVDLGNLSNEEIKTLEEPTKEIMVNKGDNLMLELKKEAMAMANQDLNLYMENKILQRIDSPCKEYLEKQYKEGNAKYVLGGERGTILMINETPASVIWGTPDSIEINGKNVCT